MTYQRSKSVLLEDCAHEVAHEGVDHAEVDGRKEEEDRRRKEEDERRAKEEAERRSKEEAERVAREAADKARREAEEQAVYFEMFGMRLPRELAAQREAFAARASAAPQTWRVAD